MSTIESANEAASDTVKFTPWDAAMLDLGHRVPLNLKVSRDEVWSLGRPTAGLFFALANPNNPGKTRPVLDHYTGKVYLIERGPAGLMGRQLETLNIDKDFSRFPAGRTRADGENSGQRLMEDFLVQVLSRGRFAVLLDGPLYGNSFLEGAFGELAKQAEGHGISREELADQILLISKNESLVQTIQQIIREYQGYP